MQWLRTGGLMTSYFILIDSVRRNTPLFKTPTGIAVLLVIPQPCLPQLGDCCL